MSKKVSFPVGNLPTMNGGLSFKGEWDAQAGPVMVTNVYDRKAESKLEENDRFFQFSCGSKTARPVGINLSLFRFFVNKSKLADKAVFGRNDDKEIIIKKNVMATVTKDSITLSVKGKEEEVEEAVKEDEIV